jgi:HlyD family secretion protein
MATAARGIFRQRPLERVSSPERLDQLLRVVGPPSWFALLAGALALGSAVAWSLLGRIPITAEGTAMLVRPRQVVAFQAPAEGRIAALLVGTGDAVAQGDLLARLALPELEKELEQQRARLLAFDSRSSELVALEHEQALLELSLLADQRDLIEHRVCSLRATAEGARARSAELIAQQRANLETARSLSQELERTLQERQQSFSVLEGQGLIARDQLVEARSRTIDKQLALAELAVLEQELRLREDQAREAYEKQQDQIVDLGLQVKDLELRELQVTSDLRRHELGQAGERQEVERRIEQLQARIASEGNVLCEYDGRILELAVLVGQRVELGSRLGRLEIEDSDAQLMALAWFEVEDGKRLRPGLEILISPSTAPRERFGSILGRVLRVSDFPVTVEAAANQIGDLELARELVSGAGRIEVLAELVADARTHSGYAWTSGVGTRELPVTSGTTAQVRVTIDERAPITFVLPFLRSLSGP